MRQMREEFQCYSRDIAYSDIEFAQLQQIGKAHSIWGDFNNTHPIGSNHYPQRGENW